GFHPPYPFSRLLIPSPDRKTRNPIISPGLSFQVIPLHTRKNAERRGTERGSLHSPEMSATNRLITSKDHASVQLNIGHLDEHGLYTGHFTTFALCGFVRAQGDGDSALDRLWQKKKAELKQ
ncbi:unnamed protein product, partial [Linum tenue]